MGNGSGRFKFAGHAIGASARFHRLYEKDNLKHVIHPIGKSILSHGGGRAEDQPPRCRYDVTEPRACCLFEVERVSTFADGRRHANDLIETEVSAEVDGIGVLERLRCDVVRMHMQVKRQGVNGEPVVTTNGNRIVGLRLGDVEAVVTMDEAPLLNSGSEDQFEAFHTNAGRRLARVAGGWRSTIVGDIRLIGSDPNINLRRRNEIVWNGFGRIILGEIHVRANERCLTLVRLDMGSDAGGSGDAGDGKTNGQPSGG